MGEDAAFTIARVRDEADLGAVGIIDEECFLNPWTREMHARELARPDEAFLHLARAGTEPAGYCTWWLVADEVHVNNLAVRPAWRRRGLARALVSLALQEGRARGARRATLEVRASNAPARGLYEGLGFRVTAVRRAYYTKPVEDALVLWHDDLERLVPSRDLC